MLSLSNHPNTQKLTSRGDNAMQNLEPTSVSLPELATRIHRAHQQCQSAVAFGLVHACDAGRWLLQAQAILTPEEWQIWLRQHCQLSEKTAQTYMQMVGGWSSLAIAPLAPQLELPESTAPIPSKFPSTDTATITVDVKAQAVRSAHLTKSENPSPQPPQQDLEPEPVVPPTAQRSQSPEILSFWIPGRVIPKARPRVTRNGTFLPQLYKQWRLRAEGEILMQLQQMHPQPQLPIQQAAVRIMLYGKHRGDGDNCIGSVCDALVSAGLLPSDTLKHLPYGYWRHIPSQTTGVKIELKPMSVSQISATTLAKEMEQTSLV